MMKKTCAMILTVIMLFSVFPWACACADDEESERYANFYSVIEDESGEHLALAALVFCPDQKVFAYSDDYYLQADYFRHNHASLETYDGSYTLKLRKQESDLDCWEMEYSSTDELVPLGLLVAAAPVKGERVFIVYPTLTDEKLFSFVSSHAVIEEVVDVQKDGSAFYRIDSKITDLAALPGMLFNQDGACVGILVGEDTAYVDWYDSTAFSGTAAKYDPREVTPKPVTERDPVPASRPIPELSVGDFVSFGKYEQDDNRSNGKEAISWMVLAVDGSRALLISRYALDAVPYNEVWKDMTWEECSLREWLNSTFINDAFTSDEKSAILTTKVDNSKSQGNSGWNKDGGYDTSDQVFLLSYKEAKDYFRKTDSSLCKPTEYAIAMGVWKNGKNYCHWWLRSPGKTQNCAAYASSESTYSSTEDKNRAIGVRPVIWVDLSQAAFG